MITGYASVSNGSSSADGQDGDSNGSANNKDQSNQSSCNDNPVDEDTFDENGKMQLCHTLNNTCVAPPRMLIAFLENNLQADGTVKIPEVLWPYMGGTKVLVPTKK